MEKYYINFYENAKGSKVKGKWKKTEEETEEEKESDLYKRRLGLKWRQTVSISKKEVEKMAEEYNMSIGDVLSFV